MEEMKELTRFFEAIREDNRIGISHICLYMAFFELWNQNNFQNPINFKRQNIMETAKISGIATFHKCIRDLKALGYIEYYPSYNPAINSKVFILKR